MSPASTLLVTGGSRGIGAAIVRQAARAGHAVGFTYVERRDAAAALVAEVQAAGGRAMCVQADVAEVDAAARVFDAVQAALGPVTALVNNAGVTGPLGRFEDAQLASLQRVLQVNVLGTMLFSQQAVRRWRAASQAGSIVNVSSIAAATGAPGEYVHYAGSKAAVEAFTIGLGRELAETGIRVNAVSPGTALTEIHAAAGQADRPQRVAARIPMRRAGHPEEIAEAVLWLLSAKASYVTASVLRVAGGL